MSLVSSKQKFDITGKRKKITELQYRSVEEKRTSKRFARFSAKATVRLFIAEGTKKGLRGIAWRCDQV